MLILKMSLILFLAAKLGEICGKESKEEKSLRLAFSQKTHAFKRLLSQNLTGNIGSNSSNIQDPGLNVKQLSIWKGKHVRKRMIGSF